MAWRDTLYSRVIAWLKIVLPLTALGLLATLFLFANRIDPTSVKPATELDLRQRAEDEQVTAPVFAGSSDSGDLISLNADAARPDPNSPGRIVVDAPRARIEMQSGLRLEASADKGVFKLSESRVILSGSAFLSSSAGYKIWTDSLDMALRAVRIESTGTISSTGPPGRFTAGQMVVTAKPDGSGTQLLFTQGVKLIYDPST